LVTLGVNLTGRYLAGSFCFTLPVKHNILFIDLAGLVL